MIYLFQLELPHVLSQGRDLGNLLIPVLPLDPLKRKTCARLVPFRGLRGERESYNNRFNSKLININLPAKGKSKVLT